VDGVHPVDLPMSSPARLMSTQVNPVDINLSAPSRGPGPCNERRSFTESTGHLVMTSAPGTRRDLHRRRHPGMVADGDLTHAAVSLNSRGQSSLLLDVRLLSTFTMKPLLLRRILLSPPTSRLARPVMPIVALQGPAARTRALALSASSSEERGDA
jgi:hypothetical protein